MRCFEPGFSLAIFFEEDYEDEDFVKVTILCSSPACLLKSYQSFSLSLSLFLFYQILRQRAKALGVTFACTGHRVLDLLRGISRPRVAPRLANLVLQEVVNCSAESGRKVVITTQALKKAFMKMFG